MNIKNEQVIVVQVSSNDNSVGQKFSTTMISTAITNLHFNIPQSVFAANLSELELFCQIQVGKGSFIVSLVSHFEPIEDISLAGCSSFPLRFGQPPLTLPFLGHLSFV
jgi:hypothetical protein